jgi:hypothetical protein
MVKIASNKDSEDSVLITENGEYGDIVVKVGMYLYTKLFECLVTIIDTQNSNIKVRIEKTYSDYCGTEGILQNSDDNLKILYSSYEDEGRLHIIPFVSTSRFDSNFPLKPTSTKWENDEYVEECPIPRCKNKFGFGIFTRKHHCRNCGKVVCNDCSKQRYKNERVCKTCFEILRILPDDTSIQDAGYKHRKNKSKRKNKRSLRRRRTSKRSNIHRKNKKVTKRLRKSRRRARR